VPRIFLALTLCLSLQAQYTGWSAVTALASGRKLTVETHDGKRQGTFVSADESSITLRSRDGSVRTISRSDIAKVRVRRENARYATAIGAAAGAAVYAAVHPRSDFTAAGHAIFTGAFAGLGAFTGWLIGRAARDRTVYDAAAPDPRFGARR
jgi:hypothetical protein